MSNYEKYARENFTWNELRCKGTDCGCGGVAYISDQALDKLQAVRDRLNTPLTINSAARCEAHNASIGGATRSEHISHLFDYSTAFDVKIPKGLTASELAQAAVDSGFKGIGVYRTFVHMDDRAKKARWNG